MADYEPPTEDLPIFDVTVFRQIAPYDEFYLKRKGLATSVATETSFSGLVSFNNLSTPPHCSAGPIDPNDLCNKAYVDSQAPKTSYIVYLNYSQTFTTSTPTIYKKLNPLTNNTPTTVAINTTNTTPVLIAGFFNTKADLKFANTIPVGQFNLVLYANCTGVSDQNHIGFYYSLVGVTPLGVETIIETSALSSLINVPAPLVGTYTCILTFVSATDITAYDQIGIKVYAISTSPASKSGSILFQYPSDYSELQTSFATTQAADLTTTNNTWTGVNTFSNTTYLNNTILQGTGTIQFPDLSTQSTAFKSLITGIYTNSNITVDAQGAISAISNGVGGSNAETIDLTLTAAGASYFLTYSSTTGAASTLRTGGLAYNRDINFLSVNVTNSTNLRLGTAGQIPYQSASTTTSFVPVGTAGQLLISNGTSAPSWSTNIGGNAGSATLVNLTTSPTNSTFYIPFSSTGSGNSSLLTDSDLLYVSSSNTINANVSGYASSAALATQVVLSQTATSATNYMVFSATALGNVGLITDTDGATYDSTTNTATLNVTGSASSSTRSNNIALTSDDSAGEWFIPFSKTTSATSNTLYIDDVTTPLTYNPSLGQMSATRYTIGGSNTVAGQQVGSLFQLTTNSIYYQWATNGQHRFYTRTALNAEINPMTINSSNVSTVVPVSIETTIVASVPSLTIKSSTSTQTINFTPFASVGTSNPITTVDSSVISCNGGGATRRLVLTTDSATTVGIRMSESGMVLGAGGTSNNPSNYLNFTSTAISLLSGNNPTISGYTLPAGSDSSTKIATTAWVQTAIPLGTVAKANNVTGGVIGNVLYQSAVDTTDKLVNGASGTVLTSGGVGAVPTWSANLAGNAGSATTTAITSDVVSATYQALTFTSNNTGNLPQKTRANVATGAGLTYIPSSNTLNVNAGGFGVVLTAKFQLKDNLSDEAEINNSGGNLSIINKANSSPIYLQTADAGGVLSTKLSVINEETETLNKLKTSAGIIGPAAALTYTSNMIGYNFRWDSNPAPGITFTSGTSTTFTVPTTLQPGVWIMNGGQILVRGTGTFPVGTSQTNMSFSFASGAGTISGVPMITAIPSGATVSTFSFAFSTQTVVVTTAATINNANSTFMTVGTATRYSRITFVRIA